MKIFPCPLFFTVTVKNGEMKNREIWVIWCSIWETGDLMKNLETPVKTGRVGRYGRSARN